MDIDDRMKDLRGTGAMTQTLRFLECAGAVGVFWGGTIEGQCGVKLELGRAGRSSMLICVSA